MHVLRVFVTLSSQRMLVSGLSAKLPVGECAWYPVMDYSGSTATPNRIIIMVPEDGWMDE